MSSFLTEKNLSDVLNILTDVISDWKILGIQLGIASSTLDTFNRENVTIAMSDMLVYWFRNHLDTSNWETLIVALEKMKRKDVAKKIINAGYVVKLNVDEEAKRIAKEIEQRKSDIQSSHFNAKQKVTYFETDVKKRCDQHTQDLKKNFRVYQRKDQNKADKLKKELNDHIKICEKQKTKLQRILSKEDFGMEEVDEIASIKKKIEYVQEQIDQIEQELDTFEQTKNSSDLVNAELDNVELVVEELMNHLKPEEVYVHSSITSQNGASQIDLTLNETTVTLD